MSDVEVCVKCGNGPLTTPEEVATGLCDCCVLGHLDSPCRRCGRSS